MMQGSTAILQPERETNCFKPFDSSRLCCMHAEMNFHFEASPPQPRTQWALALPPKSHLIPLAQDRWLIFCNSDDEAFWLSILDVSATVMIIAGTAILPVAASTASTIRL